MIYLDCEFVNGHISEIGYVVKEDDEVFNVYGDSTNMLFALHKLQTLSSKLVTLVMKDSRADL